MPCYYFIKVEPTQDISDTQYHTGNSSSFLCYQVHWLSLHGLPFCVKGTSLGNSLSHNKNPRKFTFYGYYPSLVPYVCFSLQGSLHGFWPHSSLQTKWEEGYIPREHCKLFIIRAKATSHHWKLTTDTKGSSLCPSSFFFFSHHYTLFSCLVEWNNFYVCWSKVPTDLLFFKILSCPLP